MDKQNRLILLFSLIALVVFSVVIVQRESLLAEERTVLLKLRPRDPRSIMQGDYMVLRYSVTGRGKERNAPSKGYVVCTEKDGVAKRVRLQKKRKPLNEGEFLIRYRTVANQISIGPDEFFFQEGRGQAFAQAQYAKVSISDMGQISLLGMYNSNKEEIK